MMGAAPPMVTEPTFTAMEFRRDLMPALYKGGPLRGRSKLKRNSPPRNSARGLQNRLLHRRRQSVHQLPPPGTRMCMSQGRPREAYAVFHQGGSRDTGQGRQGRDDDQRAA